MTQELTVYQAGSFDDMMRIGTLLAQSGFFADSREAAQAVTKMMAGAELGFGPIASMTGVNIIKGKVTLSANLIAAAIKRSGRYNYRVRKMTDDTCEIVFYEGKDEIGVSSFSMTDAKAAGLATGDNWRKFPRNMLFARAISNGAKWYCPDLSGGPLYTPDELGAMVDGETGEVVDAPVVVKPPQPAPWGLRNEAEDAMEAPHYQTPSKPALPATDAATDTYQPEPGEEIWADWRKPTDAHAWAMTQGKFNGQRHMENAYAKVKGDCAPKTAREMWRCWYLYVMAHEPAKSTAVADPDWAEVDAHGHDMPDAGSDEQPLFG